MCSPICDFSGSKGKGGDELFFIGDSGLKKPKRNTFDKSHQRYWLNIKDLRRMFCRKPPFLERTQVFFVKLWFNSNKVGGNYQRIS